MLAIIGTVWIFNMFKHFDEIGFVTMMIVLLLPAYVLGLGGLIQSVRLKRKYSRLAAFFCELDEI